VYIPKAKVLSTDELFKSAAYLTEAFTGVQLPSIPVASGSAATVPSHGDHMHTPIASVRTDAHTSYFSDNDVYESGLLTPPETIRAKLNGTKSERLVTEVETLPAFNLAFNTPEPFFEWLENGGLDALGGSGVGAGRQDAEPAGGKGAPDQDHVGHARNMSMPGSCELHKSFRLERFSQAMTGTSGWEANGAILSSMFLFLVIYSRVCVLT